MTNPDIAFPEIVIILDAIKKRDITQEIIDLAKGIQPEYLWDKYLFIRALAGGNLNLSWELAEIVEEYAVKEFPEFFEENENDS